LQAPLGSSFTATSTANGVIKGVCLAGKVAIVTGGYMGIGLETTKTLAAAGATVIVPALRAVQAAHQEATDWAKVALGEDKLDEPVRRFPSPKTCVRCFPTT
jgi:NAD(P)-dependent dehydrogenase (short-subunit alcohol dehydrogenase family)